ncbi:hypothetical protein KW805_02230 [Candidatus Pacearchaeota archaeon]|nr:hypothetical protein [Candidatus Pacearchaeota archaeon]
MKFIVFSLVALVVLLSLASAETNATIEEKATECLHGSEQVLLFMTDAGLPTQRTNDLFRDAQSAYAVQAALKQGNKSADFSGVLPYCNDIDSIYRTAIDAKDQVTALKKFYQESVTPDINATSADIIIREIDDEMRSERYEKVQPLVDSAYEEIIRLQASHTTLNVFYQSTSRGIKSLVLRHWKGISSFCAVIIFSFIIYRVKILKFLIMRKLRRLELRKKILKDLIIATQKEYFTYGRISEAIYHIRTNKFAELMRDIERQVPLLYEDIAKLERGITWKQQ